MAVVAGPFDDGALSQPVSTTVTDMGPIGTRTLHEADDACRSRPGFLRQTDTEGNGRVMGTPNRQVQKPFRVEQGPAGFPEFIQHAANGHLGRLRPIGMTAHPVDNRKENRPVAQCYGDSILVFFTIPQQAQVGVLDLQRSLRHVFFSCTLTRGLYHSTPASRKWNVPD